MTHYYFTTTKVHLPPPNPSSESWAVSTQPCNQETSENLSSATDTCKCHSLVDTLHWMHLIIIRSMIVDHLLFAASWHVFSEGKEWNILLIIFRAIEVSKSNISELSWTLSRSPFPLLFKASLKQYQLWFEPCSLPCPTSAALHIAHCIVYIVMNGLRFRVLGSSFYANINWEGKADELNSPRARYLV